MKLAVLTCLFLGLIDSLAQDPQTNLVAITASSFNSDNEGWSRWDTATAPIAATYQALGGNPGGFVRFTETQGDGRTEFWQAPTNYLGNMCAAYGGRLRFDLRKGILTSPFGGGSNMVILRSTGMSLLFHATNQPTASWTSFDVPIAAERWLIQGANLAPSQSQMIAVLSSLSGLFIRAEFRTGDDRTDLDNVVLLAPEGNVAPRLHVKQTSESTATLTWPACAVCFALEQSPVCDDESWSLLSASPTQQNDHLVLDISTQDSQSFYKLSRLTPPAAVSLMVGHVTDTTAELWAHAGTNSQFQIEVRDHLGNPAGSAATASNNTNHNAARVTFDALAPATLYQYSVRINGLSNSDWSGRFRTAPPAGAGARFILAVSSCMNYNHSRQSAWNLLRAQEPDFQLLLGDNVYANTTDREHLWLHHLRQRAVPEFANVIKNVPTYAIWDDHDYGPNNSSGAAAGKENSLRAFKELFANPSAGTETTPGVFFKFEYSDVEFFMLDDRYHRSPNSAPNNDSKRMLGDGQLSWLMDALRNSHAKFKMICSGSTLDSNLSDDWSGYDYCRNRLFKEIRDNRIGGVMFLTGDIHQCNLKIHPGAETAGYDVYEVISSGIALSTTDRGFVTLKFDTTVTDPTVEISIFSGNGTVRLNRVVRSSELEP